MITLVWLIAHLLNALFWWWIYAWGGARWLEHSFLSGFLVSWFAPRWSAEGLRLFAFGMLIVGAISFLVGLFVPELRCGRMC